MRRLALCLPLLFLLGGCQAIPYPRELESTLLVRVLGVDWDKDGVTLTAAELPEEGTPAVLLTAWGRDFESCLQELKEAGEEYVALTHVTQILVGEESELEEVLLAALEQKEVGQSATVWRTEGSARALMELTGGGARRLTSLELNRLGLKTQAVLEVLSQIEETGWAALPRLELQNGILEVKA